MVPGCAQRRAAELKRALVVAAAPHREWRAALSSALCDSDTARGNGMELWQGRGSWGSGKGAAPEGSGHGPTLLEFRECMDTALTKRVALGSPVWWLTTLCIAGWLKPKDNCCPFQSRPFQPRPFYMI